MESLLFARTAILYMNSSSYKSNTLVVYAVSIQFSRVTITSMSSYKKHTLVKTKI